MSDATDPDAGDFRGTRETKRRDETVMLGQDSLGAMLDEAKAPVGSVPAAPAAPVAPVAPVDATASLSGTRLIILATGAIVILVVIIALVYSVVS